MRFMKKMKTVFRESAAVRGVEKASTLSALAFQKVYGPLLLTGFDKSAMTGGLFTRLVAGVFACSKTSGQSARKAGRQSLPESGKRCRGFYFA